jgi:hypothetical protein
MTTSKKPLLALADAVDVLLAENGRSEWRAGDFYLMNGFLVIRLARPFVVEGEVCACVSEVSILDLIDEWRNVHIY